MLLNAYLFNCRDNNGVYSKDVAYEVYNATGPCGLTLGDHSGDDVFVVRNREDNVSISFGIPGHFWTEVPATYYEQIDAAGVEYFYTATGAMLEGGDWTNAPFTIEGKFEGGESGSAWAHVIINGSTCTADFNLLGQQRVMIQRTHRFKGEINKRAQVASRLWSGLEATCFTSLAYFVSLSSHPEAPMLSVPEKAVSSNKCVA